MPAYKNNISNNIVSVIKDGGGGSSGVVTDEGVVIGNPNVDNSTFGNSYGANVTPTSAPDTPSVDVSYNANSGSNGASSGSTPPPTSNEAPSTPPKPPENPTSEEAGTYYDYLKDEVPESLRDIYNDEIIYQDQQNAQLIEDINGIRDTTIEGAGEIRDTAYENAETQKETTYTYADKVLMETLGFNEEQYKYLLDSINASKETGLALAEDVRATLLALATETRDQIYQAAEAARVREYEQAEIVRQRGIVDANTSYEQNKATYGANAEALASMGLTGGGYSDYLNAQAYAAQRGEVQAVNADAEATKRAARYAEDDKKMNADTTYAANVKEAELNYSEQVGEVNATYDAALREANLWKSEADHNANRENTDTKFAADTTYNAAIGEADATYAANVADVNYQADIAIAEANAATAQAKHEAEQKLNEGLITNAQAVAEYKDTMFYHFLEKAGAGNYTAEQLEAIADRLELDDTQKQELLGALNKYNADVAAAEEDDGGGCFALGSLVTLEDGSQAPIETLKEGENVLVFNHFTGKTDVAKILFIYHEGLKVYDILKLHFDGASDTEVVYAHGFFDLDQNEYVLVTYDNAKDYIGHRFLCTGVENGEMFTREATLTGCEIYKEVNECFTVVSTKHINCIVNNLLTLPDNNHTPPKLLGFNSNLFGYNPDHTFNKEQMESDIAKYGLVTYEEWCELAPNNTNLSGLFFGIGGEYLKIALGKGAMTLEDLAGYIEIGADHTENT